MSFLRVLEFVILRVAALLVPRSDRREWLAEWTSEAWHVRRQNSRASLHFCLGSARDAFWMRRHSERPPEGDNVLLQTPSLCLSLLFVAAASMLFFVWRSPASREFLPLDHGQDSPRMVTVNKGRSLTGSVPTVSFDEYRSLLNEKDLFTDAAFYRLAQTRVAAANHRETALYVALANGELLTRWSLPVSFSIPESGRRGPALVLREAIWRKRFGADPQIFGRSVSIGGITAVVAGVLPGSSPRLPSAIDAWVLNAQEPPGETLGFMMAALGPSSAHPESKTRWRISIPGEEDQPNTFYCMVWGRRPTPIIHLLGILFAVLILPATTSLSLGEYGSGRPLSIRARRWMFLAIKVGLLVVIVFCGVLNLAAITGTPIQPHGWLLGYILAFRWALIDQRRRCPVCLRLLGNATQIGSSSQTFLEWYGAELMCDRGHGLLYVPAVSASSLGAQRWLYLDATWRPLFLSPADE